MGANWISCQRVKFQEIDAVGKPVGAATYGVTAADAFKMDYIDVYDTLEELNTDIAEKGMLGLLEADFDTDIDDPVFKDTYHGPKPEYEPSDEEESEDDEE